MNEYMRRAQATINGMKLMANALEELGEQLPQNPKLYAMLAESPLEDMRRMCIELDQYLEQIRQNVSATTPAAPIVDNSISSPAAPGPIESAS